ncbi:ABC transporter permease [Desulfatitalea alkaliphila]|uniref:ABC transporter permease n=1 Tax=Desulfatitalea alkaliphila TaxID=2929485 RepID=A0AA41QY87_9BACT|nr:ABC transporter permease [Desulfatitalea alkaliphila]MCJ8499187.1 ABC transporter permease [Desulfatitalea alkaliphila]
MNFDTTLFLQALLHRAPGHIAEHLQLVLIPLTLAVLIAMPAGILLTRPAYRRQAERVMSVFNAGQTIPPLAVIALFFPFMGLGYGPAVLALTIYALLPIARNTVAAIASVPEEVKEAARGMGMTPGEIFFRVELPLSIPTIMTGIKTAAVLTVSTAVLAALVGGKGMGAIIFAGIHFFRFELVLAGTLYIGIMAISLERGLALLERKLTPPHLKSARRRGTI